MKSYLGVEALAFRSGCVCVGGDGGAGVDVICVDVVADATAHRAAVIPAGHGERKRFTLYPINNTSFTVERMGAL